MELEKFASIMGRYEKNPLTACVRKNLRQKERNLS
jgi:hypothetical protein